MRAPDARKKAKLWPRRQAIELLHLLATLKNDGVGDDDEATLKARTELDRVYNEKAVYNARQLALKISATHIRLHRRRRRAYHCLAVADRWRFCARDAPLHRAARLRAHRLASTATPIRDGKVAAWTAEAAAAIARVLAEITALCGQTGTNDVILEFKVYFPYLLMSKKRYAN